MRQGCSDTDKTEKYMYIFPIGRMQGLANQIDVFPLLSTGFTYLFTSMINE